MFTGIVQAVGHIATSETRGGDCRLHIATGKLDLADVQLGDSIASNGVCLTVVELPGNGFVADVSVETLTHTTLGALKSGSRVNLEKALTASSRLGGHLVSGHVDGVGEVLSLHADARATRYRMRAPAVEGAEFELAIVPHTTAETIFGDYRPGSRVNLEVDVIARYLERLLLGEQAADPVAGISKSFLAEYGFLKGDAV